ncbi:Uncharacterised protein [uncultured archaeon]|nr:Uncharacterised protein [uncultured archaeon]
MRKFTELFLPIIIIALVFFPQAAHAESPIVVQPVININLGGVIDAINQKSDFLKNAIDGLKDSIAAVFKDYFEGSAKEFNDPLVGFLEYLVSANPDPDSVKGWFDSIALLLSSFYLLMFSGAGLMFLLSGISPEKRFEAKQWLKNSVIIIAAIAVSFPLYKMLLELSTAITIFIFGSGQASIFGFGALYGQGIASLLFLGFAASAALFTIFLRYLFLTMGVALFPIGIFLSLVPPLRPWGRALLNILGAAMAMQFIDAILLAAAGQMATGPIASIGGALIPAFAFLCVAGVNLAFMLFALMKSAFEAMGVFEEIGPIIHSAVAELKASNSLLEAGAKNYRAG